MNLGAPGGGLSAATQASPAVLLESGCSCGPRTGGLSPSASPAAPTWPRQCQCQPIFVT